MASVTCAVAGDGKGATNAVVALGGHAGAAGGPATAAARRCNAAPVETVVVRCKCADVQRSAMNMTAILEVVN